MARDAEIEHIKVVSMKINTALSNVIMMGRSVAWRVIMYKPWEMAIPGIKPMAAKIKAS
jgi:hypothetical protein